MDSLLQDQTLRSQLETLVSQQRYEDVLALLNQALAQNPQDRDACLFRLLVARIVVLHQRLDADEASLRGLSKHRISHVLERSSHATLIALRAAHTGFAQWLLTLYADYRLDHRRLSGRDRLSQRLSCRLQDLVKTVCAAAFDLSKTLALGTQNRLRNAWRQCAVYTAYRFDRSRLSGPPRLLQRLRGRGQNGLTLAHATIFRISQALLETQNRLRVAWRPRAILMVSAVGCVSIVTALCGILLTDFVKRSPAVAQAPGAKSQKVGGPTVSSGAPLSGREIPPPQEKFSIPDSPGEQPSPAGQDLRAAALIRPSARRSEARPSTAKVAPAAPSNDTEKSDAAATKPAFNTARVENDRPTIAKPSAAAVSSEKKSPLNWARISASTHYRARQPIVIRKAARFGAPTVDELEAGASVAVLDIKDSWAKILLDGKSTGFVRIEFLALAP